MSEGLCEYRPGLKKLILRMCESEELSDLKKLLSHMIQWYIENYIADSDIKNLHDEAYGLDAGKFVICTKKTFIKLKEKKDE